MNDKVILSQVESMIYVIRGQRVMLDRDLADLYGVETRTLNQSVKRNIDRFPEDFMFKLSQEEFSKLALHNESYGGQRYLPFVFTENGVAMLSSVLKSKRAIQINISIMRIFTKLRSFLAMGNSTNEKIDELGENTHKLFKVVFERLDQVEKRVDTYEELVTPKLPANRKKIGFKKDND